MDEMSDIERIKKWLEDNERSIAWLARKIDWTRSQLSHVLNGNRPMSRKLARDLSDVLGFTVQGSAHGNTKIDDEDEIVATAAHLIEA